MEKNQVCAYIQVLSRFLEKSVSVNDFEKEVLDLLRHDNSKWEKGYYAVLNRLSIDVDAFCSNPELFDKEQDITEDQLRYSCELILEVLQALYGRDFKD